MSTETKHTAKKAYRTPQFRVYGNIRQITLSIQAKSGNDAPQSSTQQPKKSFDGPD